MHTIPSGIKRGTVTHQFFRDAERIPIPEHLMPVIEDGTYDQTKECVFHVLALRCFDVLMEDLMADFAYAGYVSRQRWVYIPEPDQPVATEVEVTLWGGSAGVETLLRYLSRKYGFQFTYDVPVMRVMPALPRRSGYVNLSGSQSRREMNIRLVFPGWR